MISERNTGVTSAQQPTVKVTMQNFNTAQVIGNSEENERSSRREAVECYRDVITVIRDPRSPLGKRFTLKADGTVTKGAAVHVANGMAVMHHVPDADALRRLLLEVADDPHAAIIPSAFKDLEIGEEFVVLYEQELEKRLQVKGRSMTKGVHQLEIDGVPRKVVSRLKENRRQCGHPTRLLESSTFPRRATAHSFMTSVPA
jgi:hypothetical protein